MSGLNQRQGLALIAEVVETEARRTFLADNGRRLYQGYFFGRPMRMPIEEFEAAVKLNPDEPGSSLFPGRHYPTPSRMAYPAEPNRQHTGDSHTC